MTITIVSLLDQVLNINLPTYTDNKNTIDVALISYLYGFL